MRRRGRDAERDISAGGEMTGERAQVILDAREVEEVNGIARALSATATLRMPRLTKTRSSRRNADTSAIRRTDGLSPTVRGVLRVSITD